MITKEKKGKMEQENHFLECVSSGSIFEAYSVLSTVPPYEEMDFSLQVGEGVFSSLSSYETLSPGVFLLETKEGGLYLFFHRDKEQRRNDSRA